MRLDHITLKHFCAFAKPVGIERLRSDSTTTQFRDARRHVLKTRKSISGTSRRHRADQAGLPGGHSELEPPVPIPNTEVKRLSVDGSVAMTMRESNTARLLNENPRSKDRGFFIRIASGRSAA